MARPHGGDGGRGRGLVGGRLLHRRPRDPRQGRAPHRPLRPRLRREFLGPRDDPGRGAGERGHPAPRMAREAGREAADRRGARRDRGRGQLRGADAEAARASGRAEGSPPGRQQVDRHGGHLALRGLWLQPRRGADRPGRKPPPPRRQGLGQARVPRLRRPGRAGDAQHQGGTQAVAAVGAARGGRRARPAGHDPGHGRPRLHRRPDPARAAQRGQGAASARRGRVDGRPCAGGGRAFLGRPRRVQASRALLFPQLPVRGGLA